MKPAPITPLPYQARIFVVDDDMVIANLLTIMLKKLGADVETFSQGQAALAAVQENPPTLVLTDLGMENMDGFELLSQIKSLAPQVGVVIVTGSASLENALRALRSGALDYVTKPLKIDNLSEVMNRTLRYQQLELLNRQYVAELAERDEKLRHELDLARTIQTALLPAVAPVVAGLDCGFLFVPSREIGGDLFDFIELPDDKLGILIADISGHGVPASLLSAMFKVLATEIIRVEPESPSQCFKVLHRRLAKTFPQGHFASAFYGVLDPHRKLFRWTKAAQEPVLLLRQGQPVQILEKGGPVLGMFDPDVFGERPYPDMELELRTGDMLFFFTDGIVEAQNPEGVQLTLEGMLSWLEEDQHLAPAQLVERIHNRTLVYTGELSLKDDLTALAVRLVG